MQPSRPAGRQLITLTAGTICSVQAEKRPLLAPPRPLFKKTWPLQEGSQRRWHAGARMLLKMVVLWARARWKVEAGGLQQACRLPIVVHVSWPPRPAMRAWGAVPASPDTQPKARRSRPTCKLKTPPMVRLPPVWKVVGYELEQHGGVIEVGPPRPSPACHAATKRDDRDWPPRQQFGGDSREPLPAAVVCEATLALPLRSVGLPGRANIDHLSGGPKGGVRDTGCHGPLLAAGMRCCGIEGRWNGCGVGCGQEGRGGVPAGWGGEGVGSRI